jgi:histidinol phosphatase-like PHP family hydrolase
MVHLANHHAHTTFSDGNASPELFILRAIEGSLVTIGISDHAPVPVPWFWLYTDGGLTSLSSNHRPS